MVAGTQECHTTTRRISVDNCNDLDLRIRGSAHRIHPRQICCEWRKTVNQAIFGAPNICIFRLFRAPPQSRFQVPDPKPRFPCFARISVGVLTWIRRKPPQKRCVWHELWSKCALARLKYAPEMQTNAKNPACASLLDAKYAGLQNKNTLS